jgi:hypothetical protein
MAHLFIIAMFVVYAALYATKINKPCESKKQKITPIKMG